MQYVAVFFPEKEKTKQNKSKNKEKTKFKTLYYEQNTLIPCIPTSYNIIYQYTIYTYAINTTLCQIYV